MKKNITFPIVDANLLIMESSKNGFIGICTNSSSPGQVLNEVQEKNRKNISVLGSLIVSRDGTERMIVNSLAHPTLKYLILFSEESNTFAPSTNLLQFISNGLDNSKAGNYIKNGVGASPYYPNLSKNILEAFKENIIVLPVFMSNNKNQQEILNDYLKWLKDKISKNLYTKIVEINKRKKIYYDALNDLLNSLNNEIYANKKVIILDSKDFQNLQLPKIFLPNKKSRFDCPFKVTKVNNQIRVDVRIGKLNFYIIGNDPFVLEYSIMKGLDQNKNLLSPLEQILLGAEIGRVSVELKNKIKLPTCLKTNQINSKKIIPTQPILELKIDKKYYYKIGTKDKNIQVMCLAYDACEEVFELISKEFAPLAIRLAKENRFENYEMDILHRLDIGTQLARATIAAKNGYSFIQDFELLFKTNKEKLPFLIAEGDTFLGVHKKVLQKIYISGLTEEHADTNKGLARSASVLAVFRNTDKCFLNLPTIYNQTDQDIKKMRNEYKKQLLRFDHDGSYSYGERTRSYFGFDQLEKTIKILKENPTKATIVQRFDPEKDFSEYLGENGEKRFSHDPCLTHDIYWISKNKLHSLHIARAHNIVNAYPENILGLYDAYVSQIRQKINLQGGDMYMLSNRANILLLTEEQKVKKILGEPMKPEGENDYSSGPFLLSKIKNTMKRDKGLFYYTVKATINNKKPNNSTLEKIENYNNVNTLKKAINYLISKGLSHNNPIISEYHAGKDSAQMTGLIFFQANVYAKKIYSTAVFINKKTIDLKQDKDMINYILTQYHKKIKVPLGEIILIYI